MLGVLPSPPHRDNGKYFVVSPEKEGREMKQGGREGARNTVSPFPHNLHKVCSICERVCEAISQEVCAEVTLAACSGTWQIWKPTCDAKLTE